MAKAEIQIENSEFRVTKWTIEPGGEIPQHLHELDYVVVPLTDATMYVIDSAGSEVVTELRVGVSYARAAGARHSVSNRGPDSIAFVEIERVS